MNFHDDLIFRINDEKECVPECGLCHSFSILIATLEHTQYLVINNSVENFKSFVFRVS